LVTILINVSYHFSLAATYRVADLSLSYPVMRGTAVVLATLVGLLLLGDQVPPPALVALCFIPIGMFVSYGGGSGARWSDWLRAPPFVLLAPLLSGIIIGLATAWDKIGMRHFPPVLYLHVGAVSICIALLPVVASRPRGAIRALLRSEWRQIITCGLVNNGAYILVLYTLSFTPVTYVAATREVSVVFGALFGALLLHEPQGVRRFVGACLIFGGVVALALLR
jgi:uncharacterized membrane protein